MTEVTLEQLERNLEAASERLGLALKSAPVEEKKSLSALYDKIKDLVNKQAAENGEAVDPSALFAAGIVGNETIKDENLIKAAIDYIDQDLAYCKFRSAQNK